MNSRTLLMRRVGFAVLLFLLPLMTARGEVSELSQLSLEELADVIVISPTRTDQKVSEAPATVHVLTAEQIRRRGYRSLVQLLEDIPEIEINARGTIESFNLTTFRGISGIEKVILIFQDGVRVNAVTGSPTANQFNFPLHNAKRVEVIIGPASALYGSDAFAGIVNIITFTAEDLSGPVVTGSGGRFSTTNDSIIYGKKWGEVGLTLNASYYYSAEPKFPDFYPDAYSGYFPYAENGTVQTNSGPTTIAIRDYSTPTKANTIGGRLRISEFELGYWRSYAAHSSSTGFRPEYGLYVEEAKISTTLESIYAQHFHSSPDGKWSLLSRLSKGSQVLGPDTKYINIYTDFMDDNGYKYESDKALILTEEATYNITDELKLVAGATYEDFSSFPKTADLTHPYNPDTGSGSQTFKYQGTNVDVLFYPIWYQNLGFYAQLQNSPNEAVQLTAGARYDHNTRFGGTLNPRVGAVIMPSQKILAKLLYGEAYRVPSPYITYENFGSFTTTNGVPTGGFFNLPNPDLKPEKLRSLEIGASYNLNPELKLSTDIFYNRVTDLIGFESLPPGFQYQGVPVSGTHRVNKSLLRSYGGTLRMDFGFQVGSLQLRPWAAYTYIDGDIDGGGLINTAKDTVKIAIDSVLGKLTLSPQIQYRSRSYGPPLSSQDVSAPPYTVVNLAARYENIFGAQNSGASAFLNIRNLLDRRYANSNEDTLTAFAATPQDPLRAELGLTYEF